MLEYIKCLLQLLSTIGVVGGGVGALLFALEQSVRASDSGAHPAHLPWNHKGIFDALDHARFVINSINYVTIVL